VRFFEAAREHRIAAKALGGIGCWLHVADHADAPEAVRFRRDYGDVDLVVPRSAGRTVGPFIESLGFASMATFNAVQGETRLMFHHPVTGLKLDVFLGTFEMCHVIALEDAAFQPVDHPSLRLAELLLTKLQVAEATDKDLLDASSLFAFHPVSTAKDPETIDAGAIAKVLSKDWGTWKTITMNLDRVDAWAGANTDGPCRQRVLDRTATLRDAIDGQSKSIGWKMRAKIGEKRAWHEAPEEPASEGERVR
jgi:hypothetical protein